MGLEQSLFAGFRLEVQPPIRIHRRCSCQTQQHKMNENFIPQSKVLMPRVQNFDFTFSPREQDYCLQPAACRKPGRTWVLQSRCVILQESKSEAVTALIPQGLQVYACEARWVTLWILHSQSQSLLHTFYIVLQKLFLRFSFKPCDCS